MHVKTVAFRNDDHQDVLANHHIIESSTQVTLINNLASMATSRKTTLLRFLVLALLGAEWIRAHGKSMPGDYDTEMNEQASEYANVQNKEAFAASEADSPWIKDELPAFNYSAARLRGAPAVDGWDVSSSQENTEPELEETTHEAELQDRRTEEDNIFVDLSETEVGDREGIDGSSDKPSEEAYKNDEVFFDTSSADTVYMSSGDDGFGVAAAAGRFNESETADAQLATLAKTLGGCGTGNPIDDCWRCDPYWRSHRQSLASCAAGFGRDAVGGKNGPIYVVTSNGDNTKDPKQGTLRHAVTREGPLWIVFERNMTIKLNGELLVSANKTIDARGAEVHITGEAQISVQRANNVIIHGLHVHDVRASGPSTIRVSPSTVTKIGKSDGDAIRVSESRDVWIDHCYLARAADGLVDVTRGSTRVTISNCVLEDQDKVMLLGASGEHTEDRDMRVTVAFNRFGAGLVQRLPRCRFGVFHVLNNDYSSGWGKYAIGGSQGPTILSQGNLFNSVGKASKEVTKRIDDKGPTYGGWEKWNWASSGDVFLNGAYFTGSGANDTSASVYAEVYSASSSPGHLVPALTQSAGPIEM